MLAFLRFRIHCRVRIVTVGVDRVAVAVGVDFAARVLPVAILVDPVVAVRIGQGSEMGTAIRGFAIAGESLRIAIIAIATEGNPVLVVVAAGTIEPVAVLVDAVAAAFTLRFVGSRMNGRGLVVAVAIENRRG